MKKQGVTAACSTAEGAKHHNSSHELCLGDMGVVHITHTF